MKLFFLKLKWAAQLTWRRLFGKPLKNLKYGKLPTSEDGQFLPDSKENRARIEILKTGLKFGDTYHVGPEATVHLAPKGKQGKAWVAARIAAADARRAAKWEAKRAWAVKVMLMSEQELIDSGIKAEVDKFLKENQAAIELDQTSGFLPLDKLRRYAPPTDLPPSSKPAERIKDAFEDIMVQAGLDVVNAEPVNEFAGLSREEFLKDYLSDKGGKGQA
jgi:hypothetical protein